MNKDIRPALVLGKNWASKGDNPELSIASKVSAIAGGYLAAESQSPVILFSGGRTAGASNPSEARAMFDYANNYLFGGNGFPKEVLLEEDSLTTEENLRGINRLIGTDPTTLVTVGYHLSRAKRIFENGGYVVSPFASEDIVQIYGPNSSDLKAFLERKNPWKDYVGEAVISAVQAFPGGSHLLDKVAAHTRQ